MSVIRHEPGCLYDTVAFLSRYFEETVSNSVVKGNSNNPYYINVKKQLEKSSISLLHYLCPFVGLYKGNLSFLHSYFFDEETFSECSLNKALVKLKNTQYFRRRYIEHYFNSSDYRTVFRKVSTHPDGINLIKQHAFDPTIEMYIYYSLIKIDEVTIALLSALETVYNKVEEEHKRFLAGSPEFISVFQSDAIAGKLRTLGQVENKTLRFSITLMDDHRIDHFESEPGFFLLGHKYEEVLATRYRYINATPFSFASVIGHLPRYQIYQALLEKSPMTRADMEKKLHLSRSALDHNIKVMCDSGMLVIDHQAGLSNFYKLDTEYIRIAAEFLLESVNIQK